MLANCAPKAGRAHSSHLSAPPSQNTIALSWISEWARGPMPGISIHVVDVSRGVVANGMRVELFAVPGRFVPRLIASGNISKTGALADPGLNQTIRAGLL